MYKTVDEVLTNYLITATIIDVYDGDSVTATFPFPGTSQVLRWKCRIYGIDTPEIKSKNPQERQLATEARDHLRELILDKAVEILCKGTDKYGRVLIIIRPSAEENIVDKLLEKGYCKRYFGKTKEKWTFPIEGSNF